MSRRTRRYEKVEFDDFDEEEEVTRCVCGHDDLDTSTINPQLVNLLLTEYQIKIDQGLFIQCDKCSVWQHGYCVGLFGNDDVPDKFWCEICKPDLHLFIYEHDQKRTLYKPVSDKRKKLMMMETERIQNKRKFTRKDRTLYDFDEQLQKALRESAKESGLAKENPEPESPEPEEPNDEIKPQPDEKSITPPNVIVTSVAEETKITETNASDEEEDEDEVEEEIKLQPKPKKPKKKEVKKVRKPKEITFTKEQLLDQPSKPRFVNEKSTIYELRKRISAILEWLNRSQLELEDEKLNKSSLTDEIFTTYNENLNLMQSLTKSILDWEEKFGKYVP